MTKIVINRCWGGFSLSDEAVELYASLKNIELRKEKGSFDSEYYVTSTGEYFSNRPEPRDDPMLIAVVEQLGEKANGDFAKLQIVEIPDDVCWEIDDYDGMERVEECHRYWS